MPLSKTFAPLPLPKIPVPLQLAIGDHDQGSGLCCAMNLVAWEDQPNRVTDEPDGVDRLLASIVRHTNDSICGDIRVILAVGDVMCPTCTARMLNLAHSVRGSAVPMHDDEVHRLWLRCVLNVARHEYRSLSAGWSVDTMVKADSGLALVQRWIDREISDRETWDCAVGLNKTDQVELSPVVQLLLAAGLGLRHIDMPYSLIPRFAPPAIVNKLTWAVDGIADLWSAADGYLDRGLIKLRLAQLVVAEFQRLTGHRPPKVTAETVQTALDRMGGSVHPDTVDVPRFTIDGLTGLDLDRADLE